MQPTKRRTPITSSITAIEDGRLMTRGIDQLDIINTYDQVDVLFLLLKGRKPSAAEKTVLRAIIVAHISHGITGQSTLAVLQAADCRSSFLDAVVAGFCVGAGVYHQGGLTAAMEDLRGLAMLSSLELEQEISERLTNCKRTIGYGHRFHRRDPRAIALVALGQENGLAGRHVQTAMEVERLLAAAKGIYMNIEAAGAGLLLDMSFDPRVAHLFIILGRMPMYAAAYLERLETSPRPFPQVELADVMEDTEDELI